MRLLITGSRGWTDESAIRRAIGAVTAKHGHELTIVHGDCPSGADWIADQVARGWGGGMKVERHPALWILHGKRAGFVRNAEMVDAGADLCLAFILNESKGATMCADLAEKAGIPVRRYEVAR